MNFMISLLSNYITFRSTFARIRHYLLPGSLDFLLKILVVFILFFAFNKHTTAQPWMSSVSTEKASGNPDFYQIQDAFYDYWEGKTIQKGKGWKQFKRWENFMAPRVYPHGNIQLPAPDLFTKDVKSTDLITNITWSPLGPVQIPYNSYGQLSGMGRINCIAFHPENENIIWVGAPSGGLWKTTNGGESWITTTDNLMSIGVSDIAVSHKNADILYIATGDGDAGDTYSIGILKSIDGGLSWQQTALTHQTEQAIHFRRIVMHPEDEDIMLAASNRGIFRTDDGWQTFAIVQEGVFKDIEIKPGKPSVFYASTANYSGDSKIYKSTDTGATFSALTGYNTNSRAGRIELAVTPANSEILMALISDSNDDGLHGVYKSMNAGVTWTQVFSGEDKNLLGWSADGSDEGGQGWYDLTLAVSPLSDRIIYVGGVNIWKSTDGGNSFTLNAHWWGARGVAYVHADQHAMVHHPVTGAFFSGNDGGIYRTTDGGKNWTDLSNGLQILQIYRIGAGSNTGSQVLAGSQDNGTMQWNSSEWQQVYGGDGMECIIDPVNEDIQYVSLYFGAVFRSLDGGRAWNAIQPEEAGNGAWVTPYVLNKFNPNVLYAGYEDVFMSADRGNHWTRISENLTGEVKLQSLAPAPSDPAYIYTATFGSIYRTKNAGHTWEDVSEGLPDQAITYIAVSQYNPLKIWVSLSGYNDGNKIYTSEDGGETWQNYSDGLPNTPVNCVLYQDDTDQMLYAGTDLGVYYRSRGMKEWIAGNTGLPNVIVNELEIDYANKKIIAGTYGRGLWESPLPPSDGFFPSFSASQMTVCIGQEITFTDQSGGNPDEVMWNFGSGATPSIAIGAGPHVVSYNASGIKSISQLVSKNTIEKSLSYEFFIDVTQTIDVNIIPGDTVEIPAKDTLLIVASGGETYNWFPAENILVNGNIARIFPSTTTTYVVEGTSGICVSSDSITVNIKPGPENDDICDATVLTYGSYGPFTNVDATVEKNEPAPPEGGCNSPLEWCVEGGLHNSVWFSFIATGSEVSIRSTGMDTQMALYKSDGCDELFEGSFSLIAANDDYYSAFPYSAALDLVPVEIGEKYYLQVDGSGGGAVGNFYLDLFAWGVNVPESISESEEMLKVFPNPSQGEFTLLVNQDFPLDDEVYVHLYNLTGELVYAEFVKDPTYPFVKEIGVIQLANGLYTIVVTSGNNKLSKILQVY